MLSRKLTLRRAINLCLTSILFFSIAANGIIIANEVEYTIETHITLEELQNMAGGAFNLSRKLDFSELTEIELEYLPVELFDKLSQNQVEQITSSAGTANFLNAISVNLEVLQDLTASPIADFLATCVPPYDHFPDVCPDAFVLLDPWIVLNTGVLTNQQFDCLVEYYPADDWTLEALELSHNELQLFRDTICRKDLPIKGIIQNFAKQYEYSTRKHALNVLPEGTRERLGYIYERYMAEKQALRSSQNTSGSDDGKSVEEKHAEGDGKRKQ